MKKYFVIGNPIDHSLSPKLHNFWIKQNSIDAIYGKQKLNEDDIKDLILDIKEKKISGINVTVPFKKKVIPYLDELSSDAVKTQSVNTILMKNKKILGFNTDIDGFENAIKRLNFVTKDKKVLILGAGGVVPSIICALIKMKVSKIFVSNRTLSKAEEIKKSFSSIEVVTWGEIPEFDLIINGTSLGLNSSDIINLDFSKVGKNKLFYDVVYNPRSTNFLKTGKELGNKFENCKLMFIYQAHQAFTVWHKITPKINNETIKLLD